MNEIKEITEWSITVDANHFEFYDYDKPGPTLEIQVNKIDPGQQDRLNSAVEIVSLRTQTKLWQRTAAICCIITIITIFAASLLLSIHR
jgi:hypothetical protein